MIEKLLNIAINRRPFEYWTRLPAQTVGEVLEHQLQNVPTGDLSFTVISKRKDGMFSIRAKKSFWVNIAEPILSAEVTSEEEGSRVHGHFTWIASHRLQFIIFWAVAALMPLSAIVTRIEHAGENPEHFLIVIAVSLVGTVIWAPLVSVFLVAAIRFFSLLGNSHRKVITDAIVTRIKQAEQVAAGNVR